MDLAAFLPCREAVIAEVGVASVAFAGMAACPATSIWHQAVVGEKGLLVAAEEAGEVGVEVASTVAVGSTVAV